jgi:putative nucleotidyltransferase with HDIG domain
MLSLSTRRYIAFIIVAALLSIAAVAALSLGFDRETFEAAAFFALVGILGYALEYQLPRGGAGNISFIPFLSGLAARPGLPIVFAVVLAVTCGEVVQRRVATKALFNVAQYTLAISLACCVFVLLGGKAVDVGSWHRSIAPFVAAFAVFLIANSASVFGVMAVSTHRSLWEIWRHNSRGAIRYDVMAMPFVYAYAIVYARYDWWALAVALPLLGLRQLYKTNSQLETINEELLQLVVAAIEARDPYTSGHSERVAHYSRIVGRAAGLSGRDLDRVETAALLHDVGKIHEEFAPILRKPGRLTSEEHSIMKGHAEKGAMLVAKVTQLRDIVPAIRNHHEFWNGAGYPDQLSRDQIPLWARVITVADTIDAMTTDRPYRAALDSDAVRSELIAQAGSQFDPIITNRLVAPSMWAEMEIALRATGQDRRYNYTTLDRLDAPAPMVASAQ